MDLREVLDRPISRALANAQGATFELQGEEHEHSSIR
jgi:hypothetical protein